MQTWGDFILWKYHTQEKSASGLASEYGLDLLRESQAVDTDDLNADSAVAMSAEAEGEARRRADLAARDPVATLQVASFFQQCLQVGCGVHGADLQSAIAGVEPKLL